MMDPVVLVVPENKLAIALKSRSRADWRPIFPNDNSASIVVRQLLSQTIEFSAETFISAATGM